MLAAMRALALRHVAHEGLGLFRPVLEDSGWGIDERDVTRPGEVPAATDSADLLIVMGGSMGVYEAGRYPFLQRELELLRSRIERGAPTLGVCLGSQLMAAALGAEVVRGPVREIGWCGIEPEPQGLADPVVAPLLGPLAEIATETRVSAMTLQWHHDTFDLPAGAVSLARSDLYRNQGFRWGRCAYALQFHPEIPPEDLPLWIERSDDPVDPETAARMIAGAGVYGDAYRERGVRFLRRLLEAVVGGESPRPTT